MQSSAGSSGKTVVDHHSTNLELQEANTRLRERLARMVHTQTGQCAAQLHTRTHIHVKKSNQTCCTRTKEMAAHTHSIFSLFENPNV